MSNGYRVTAGSSTTSMTMVVSSEEMMHFIMGSRQKYVLMRIREMITSRVDTPVTMGQQARDNAQRRQQQPAEPIPAVPFLVAKTVDKQQKAEGLGHVSRQHLQQNNPYLIHFNLPFLPSHKA